MCDGHSHESDWATVSWTYFIVFAILFAVSLISLVKYFFSANRHLPGLTIMTLNTLALGIRTGCGSLFIFPTPLGCSGVAFGLCSRSPHWLWMVCLVVLISITMKALAASMGPVAVISESRFTSFSKCAVPIIVVAQFWLVLLFPDDSLVETESGDWKGLGLAFHVENVLLAAFVAVMIAVGIATARHVHVRLRPTKALSADLVARRAVSALQFRLFVYQVVLVGAGISIFAVVVFGLFADNSIATLLKFVWFVFACEVPLGIIFAFVLNNNYAAWRKSTSKFADAVANEAEGEACFHTAFFSRCFPRRCYTLDAGSVDDTDCESNYVSIDTNYNYGAA